VTILLFGAPLAFSQSQPPDATPLHSATELVKLDVSVLDKHGNFVADLNLNQFHILDNGSEQPIAFFEPVEAPAQILVMIETSPAVYLIHTEHLVAAYALFEGLAANDQVAVVTYSDKPRTVLGFTPDKNALLEAMNNLNYAIGMSQLNFYDSLTKAIDWLPSGTGKSAIVLLTTGLDSSTTSDWEALVSKLRVSDVVVFPVALGGYLHGGNGKTPKSKGDNTHTPAPGGPSYSIVAASFAQADDALRSLAEITGGRAYFPESAGQFVAIYHEIGAALRHEYVLGIAPAHDGQFHSLTVQVYAQDNRNGKRRAARSGWMIFAREGYLAPSP
jgi:Ca-activated chloride channel homolog